MNNPLNLTVNAFNQRRFDEATNHAAEGLAGAQGSDEVFWMGLQETCEGYALLHTGKMLPAERKLVGAMQKLRSFGFQYQNFEVTAALAGIRRSVEEIRVVRQGPRKVFDVSLLPRFRMARMADET